MDGKIINKRYEIIDEIGCGGMGVVYKAKCNLLNRFVAIKILDKRFVNDKDFIKRFKIEAQSAASLSHQNIVSVYDIGFEDNNQFIVMEYVDGITLKEYVENKAPIDWQEVVNIAKQICLAIDHAHKNNIIHRDIKPHNILITKSGEIKVTDFGIAKAITNNTLTIAGNAIGSVHYFSPEQAKGESVGIKSDFYSLGITMYEMVTSVLPFDGDSQIAVALQHINRKPKPPIDVQNNIPKELNAIIMKTLKKDPNSRYQNASDIFEALNNLLNQPDKANFIYKVDTVKRNFSGKFSNIKKQAVNKFNVIKNDLQQSKENTPESISKNDNKKEINNSKKPQLFDSFSDFNIKEFINSNYGKKNTFMHKFNQNKQNHPNMLKEKKNFIIIIVMCVFLLLTIILVNIINPQESKFNVGNYIGQDYNNTIQNLQAAGWNVNYINLKEITPKNKVVKNKIIEQQPPQGKTIKINVDKIKLYFSNGQEKIKTLKIPHIIGKEYQDSHKKLKKLGFKNIKLHKKESDNKKNTITNVKPKIGSSVKSNQIIHIYYSTGKAHNFIEIPNLVGLTKSQAQNKLKDLKLTIGTLKPEDADKDAIIISQNPKSGFMAKKGQGVDLNFKEEEQEEQEKQEVTKKPTDPPTPKPTPRQSYDDGTIQLSRSWFSSRSAPYFVQVEYIAVGNSSKRSEASWNYNLIEQVPNSVSVNNIYSGETYRRIITVNGSTVDDRIVKVH